MSQVYPEGTVISLTEEKMQKYPALASLVKASALKNSHEEMILIPCKVELAMEKEGLISPGGASPPVFS